MSRDSYNFIECEWTILRKVGFIGKGLWTLVHERRKGDPRMGSQFFIK